MPVKPEAEEPQIIAYAARDSIHVNRHSSGIYYEIIDPGNGLTPTLNSKLSVTYTGELLNGTKFDEQTNPVDFNLSGVIEGWQIGIPLIKKGGRIKLIIPSAYAYGCNGSGLIPPNSTLFFDVNLIDVK
ncbi:MAG TPA: FKBP-type peptidyl-prolyl cis-trans isomerase [Segetibacter sp.]|nr:FKBP-type peptidyl-prolyl cis-trans isomerase [Segetibacter sp.]